MNNMDAGVMDTGSDTTVCNNPPLSAPATGTCEFTSQTGGATLIQGDIVTPDGVLQNGHLL